nr:bifunctional nuclease family protein [Anaerolineae bacterium]
MVRVEIDSIRVSLMSQERIVILKEIADDRYLPIWIGAFEAEAIRVELQDITVTRPLTHDLLKSVIVQLGGKVDRVVVTDLRQEVFFAEITINTPDGEIKIDSRPSDAIALAVRLKVPIFVEEKVMDRAAIRPEEESSTETTSPGRGKPGAPELEPDDAEEVRPADLSLFEDFLDTLDMDDLEDPE